MEVAYYEEILDSMGEGLVTIDKDFRITYFNRAAEKMTGFDRNDVLGRLCKLVLDCEFCETKCPIGLVLEARENIYDYSSTIKINGGTYIPVKLNATILKDHEDSIKGGLISFRRVPNIEEINANRQNHSSFQGIIGHGKKMQQVFELIREISDSDATVLIQGESGTGKEMIANAIKATGKRKDKPFVKVNCSVFPENLLASELFGHVKGAFTDAVHDRTGRFELANGGTIFLDEVAEMPMHTQVQLLRILQEGTFERVGESISRGTNVRVIAATNVNISEALKSGKLREDLYYRLNVIPVLIPPLRDRKEDIPHLVKFFTEDFSNIYKKNIYDITNVALDILTNHNWPGNVRELENVIEYAVVRTNDTNLITKDSLPIFSFEKTTDKDDTTNHSRKKSTHEIIKLLEKHQWNKSKVAEEMGIGRTTLWRMLKRLPEFD